MKTIETSSTTSRKKKLPSVKVDRQLKSERAYKLGRSDERFSFTKHGSAYRRQCEALQRARKQTRELKREVSRLNALVVKLAEKL